MADVYKRQDCRECAGINRKTNEIYEANYDFARAKSAYVFKTMVDPFIGKYSFIKVCSGVLKGEDVLYNSEDVYKRQGIFWPGSVRIRKP